MSRFAASCLVTLGLTLCACRPAAPDKIDPEGLDAVGLAVEDQLNEPAAAIYALLRSSAQAPQVGWDTLVINIGEPEPVNWWLMKRGYLELSGAQFASRAAFTLTKPVQDLLASPDQPWFEANITGEPEVDCKTPAALAATGCEVAVEITPALTAAGKTAIGEAKLEPFTVHAVVALGPEDWQVTNLTADAAAISEIGLTAILGPKEVRDAQAGTANTDLKGRMRSLAGDVDAPINLEAFTPPNYVEPPPPVAAMLPPPPTGRPDSPFRPGR